MDKITELLDIMYPGWRYIDEEGTEWKIGDRVTWEEPIGGGEYVRAVGTIYGLDHETETALVHVKEPFMGDRVEVRLMHLEHISRQKEAR